MGDEQQRAAVAVEQAFQPFDGGEVEMVGGFVEQQQFRLGDQGASQGDPLLLAAGQGVHLDVGRQVEPAQGLFHPAAQTPGVVRFELVAEPVQLVETAFAVRDPAGATS